MSEFKGKNLILKEGAWEVVGHYQGSRLTKVIVQKRNDENNIEEAHILFPGDDIAEITTMLPNKIAQAMSDALRKGGWYGN